MKRTYPLLTMLSLLVLSSLNACSSHKTPNISIDNHKQVPPPISHDKSNVTPAISVDPMQAVTDLVLKSENANQLAAALEGLQELAIHASSPVKEAAAFRRVQLLLKHQYANADIEAHYVLLAYPHDRLVADLHFWFAQWWQVQEPVINPDMEVAQIFILQNSSYANHVLDELTAALRQENIDNGLLQRCIALSQKVISRGSIEHRRAWYFAVAHADLAHRDYWVQLASNDLSIADLQSLQVEQLISPEQDGAIYLHVARQAMMKGNMNALQQLLAMLQIKAPDLPVTRTISSWLYGASQPLHLGVLLPLTGKYARFAQQALNGIRLAADRQGQHITLSIQDTATQSIQEAYQALHDAGVDAIIGPLLSNHTETLATQLDASLPIMALSMRQGAANLSPALFIHNISPETQGKFIASYAISQGLHRIAVIQTMNKNSEREALSFINSFADLGGEIANQITLNEGIDHRPTLLQLRENSDDKALLQQLIEKRALFIPEQRLDIHLPANMDGLYLANNGKQVSELAGQLAYVDIRKIPLLGSSRWMDGHLLDDRGRNLSTARFIQDIPNLHNSDLKTYFHEVWGKGEPSKLLSVAYDSTQIFILLVTRLGLTGGDIIQALHSKEGFPSETGLVHFNDDGVGEKTFSLYRIQQHAIVPAQ
ncbi:MAG: penicillin-binding protein activator [Mariprofundaceae bacterium]|nr:penicillin-binding protein activator [Mariprofundaceae bacterium]